MTGIPPKLIRSLHEVLEECEQFETNRGIRNLFLDERIIAWRNSLPQSDSPKERAESVVSYLHDKNTSNGSNVLVLMLLILADRMGQQDSRGSQLRKLAYELAEAVGDQESLVTTAQEKHSPESHLPIAQTKVQVNDSVEVWDSGPPSENPQITVRSIKTDFFISYNRNDKKWAEWIAWQLENAGYTTVFQSWDFHPGSNFVMDMQSATATSERTIAVLSPDYLNSRFTQPEWNAAFALDPTGEKGKLLPIRVRYCELVGLLPQIVYIDLVNLSETDAIEALLTGVKRTRAKPLVSPNFPGTVERAKPEFPQKKP